MAGSYSDNELTVSINGLSGEQKRKLAKLPPDVIRRTFDDIKTSIAIEAKKRVQAKIATTFTGGYGNGALFESIYYTIDGDNINVSSTKSYFAILNAGYKSFDMKKALGGKRVGMKMPGGAIIYRTVGGDTGKSPKRQRPGKVSFPSGWIHPGYEGKHIYEQVEKEMELFVKTYVRQQIQNLMIMAGVQFGVKKIATGDYAPTQNGSYFYNKRNAKGQFSKRPQISGPGRLMRTDLMTMNYNRLKNGAVVPNLGAARNE